MEPVILVLILLVAVGMTAAVVVRSRRSSSTAEPDLAPTRPPRAPKQPPTPVATPAVETAEPEVETAEPTAPVAEPVERVKPRLRDRLGKTRAAFAGAFTGIAGRGKVDDETWDDLEEALILADVGVPTTTKVIEAVRERATAEKVSDPARVIELLREELVTLLSGTERELQRAETGPSVWMFVGVNGVGKTTSIAKLAQREVDAGHRVVLAAADTFRAAAAEQLATWAERTGSEIVRGQDGADPGSIVFDAMSAASTRGADVVLVDTAGRLHNKVNLMEELKKLRRIVDRTEGALREVLLVVDASTGQNGLTQARQFAETVDITGIVLTKLDGTAKGGIVLAIQSELGISVKVVGVGETADDLIPFDPEEFVAALF
ncbi:MAG: signal recognition particle-docking protein FtsY [Acidimicrobiia bacterium]